MRVIFPTIKQAKKSAKLIASAFGVVKLNQAQEALARSTGYRDWHDLEAACASAPDGSLGPITLSVEEIVSITISLRNIINCDWSTALYIASIAHIPGLHFQSQNEYEYVWLQLMYQLFGFSQEKNSIGHIVKLKLPGRHNSPAYVKEHNGTFLRLITDRSLDTGVASFEIRNPRTQPEPFVPKRLVYAYGSWREKDGSLVLFSRDYKPLWRVRKNKHPERVSPWLWIDFVEQEHFWGDENCPWDSKKRQLEENQRLHCYGVKGLPMLSDVLPYALSSQATPRIDELIKMLAAERRVALADTIVGPFKPESIN